MSKTSMRISQKGIDLLKYFEGLKLQSYLCPGNVWSIGWGATQIYGKKVKEGDVISIECAEELLFHDIQKFENLVNEKINIDISQKQFDALVLHSFNTGGSETLFDMINKREPLEKIREWIENTYITANGKFLNGLIIRRKEEANLFCRNS
jgi:lysozyme